jgi:hypothetical protein
LAFGANGSSLATVASRDRETGVDTAQGGRCLQSIAAPVHVVPVILCQ